jgi:serine/threonine protein kinase
VRCDKRATLGLVRVMGAEAAVEEQFGPYLVYERLGVGGMATVHRALERGIEGFERVVALKRLLPHLAEDASFIKSFVREAKLASLLSHVNIVQILELGRVGSQYFISMEYIDGRDIRRILRHARRVCGPPPIHVTVGLLLQLCDALDYAHTRVDEEGHPLGLVHRDVSPSNLLITSAGHLKVIDFGIAKAQSAQLRTQTGRVKGKLAYMAPEAIAGRELDARSDLFACGVITHELLTARPLFASKNEYQTLMKVQRGDIVPPSTFNQACPPELDAIALRALARDPDERFSGAAELRDELHAIRRAYKLETGFREVAAWIDWAFSQEPPRSGSAANAFNTIGRQVEPSHSLIRQNTPSSKVLAKRDEEDVVEIAWGDSEAQSGPILLDDIPDVSDKHLAIPRLDSCGDDPWGKPDENNDEIGNGRALAGAAVQAPRAQRVTGTPAARDSEPVSHNNSRLPTAGRASTGTLPPASARARRISQSVSGPIPEPIATNYDSAWSETPHNRTTTAQGVGATAVDTTTEALTAATLLDSEKVARGSEQPHTHDGLDPEDRISQTKPGAPSGAAATIAAEQPSRPVSRRSASVSIGGAIVARNRHRRLRSWLVALVLAGSSATALYLYLHRSAPDTSPQPPTPPAHTTGTLRFQTEPANAEIRIEGQPIAMDTRSIELAQGSHQIEIHAPGFKTWLTSIDLAAGETQTLRVVLEPLGGAAAASEAMLKIASIPPGLELVLDGSVLAQHTPLRMPIKVGPHTVVLRQNGIEVWRQSLTATANINYEYNPTLVSYLRKPEPRPEDPPRANTVPPEAPPPSDASSETLAIEHGNASAQATSSPPASTELPVLPPPTPPTLPAKPATSPPQVPPAAPAEIGTDRSVLVSPTAVTRVGGDTPSIASNHSADMPSIVAAKVCINTGGRVTAAEVISRIDPRAASDIIAAISTWEYAPYKRNNVALAACFVVRFRVHSPQ